MVPSFSQVTTHLYISLTYLLTYLLSQIPVTDETRQLAINMSNEELGQSPTYSRTDTYRPAVFGMNFLIHFASLPNADQFPSHSFVLSLHPR